MIYFLNLFILWLGFVAACVINPEFALAAFAYTAAWSLFITLISLKGKS